MIGRRGRETRRRHERRVARAIGALAARVSLGKVRGKVVMLTREKVAMLRHHWVCDSTKTQDDVGWKPEVRFADGVHLTAKWYQDNGWL